MDYNLSIRKVVSVILSLIFCAQVANAEETIEDVRARVDAVYNKPQVECHNCSAWHSANKYTFIIEQPALNYKAIWEFQITPKQDILVKIDASSKSKSVKGEMLFISGRTMLTKGLTFEPGSRKMDLLDEGALWLQLVIRLLDQSFPSGPQSVIGSMPIKATHNTLGIHVNTSGARGDFPAPWRTAGTATRKDNSTINYNLNFSWGMSSDSHNESLNYKSKNISGHWHKDLSVNLLPDNMSLAGWDFYSEMKFSDLGELRTYINDHNSQHQ
jgi:hypothetical protein